MSEDFEDISCASINSIRHGVYTTSLTYGKISIWFDNVEEVIEAKDKANSLYPFIIKLRKDGKTCELHRIKENVAHYILEKTNIKLKVEFENEQSLEEKLDEEEYNKSFQENEEEDVHFISSIKQSKQDSIKGLTHFFDGNWYSGDSVFWDMYCFNGKKEKMEDKKITCIVSDKDDIEFEIL